jgi:hypothetical protein
MFLYCNLKVHRDSLITLYKTDSYIRDGDCGKVNCCRLIQSGLYVTVLSVVN